MHCLPNLALWQLMSHVTPRKIFRNLTPGFDACENGVEVVHLSAKDGRRRSEIGIKTYSAEGSLAPMDLLPKPLGHFRPKFVGADLHNFGSILVGAEHRGQIPK
jgi:hypothetical protein